MDVLDHWNATTDEELTTELVKEYFAQPLDGLYLASSAVDRLAKDPKLQRLILNAGLKNTESAVEKGKNLLGTTLLLSEVDAGNDNDRGEGTSSPQPPSIRVNDEHLIRLLSLRYILLQRLLLLDTYNCLESSPSWNCNPSQGEVDAEVADDDFDPWGDGKIDVSDTTPFIPPPLSLPDFLLHGALWGALQLARDCHFEVLQLLVDKHSNDLFPYRFAILDAIPLHTHPMRYLSLFPSVNVVNGEEKWQSRRSPREQDWVESEDGKSLYFLALPQDLSDYIHSPTFGLHSQPSSQTHNQLQNWYKARIAQIEAEAGLTDIALELAQVAASLGVSGLEHLGEELSLLSRLIYDAPGAQAQNLVDAAQWSLSRWQSSDAQTIIQGYLKSSTTETISDDIRRLVIPYLYVLESRLERAGRPDANLHTHLLYDYILSAPLEFCLSIFDASKPVNPSSTRIIRNDEDLARLALARLYSSDELDQWSMMSNIFECLPEWPIPAAEHQHDGDAEAETTLASLTAFVQPSTTRSNVAPPQDLFAFFKPLLSTALSHALDILDVHLECGEILARWGVAAPLFWFLQSARDERQQRAWATRMARRPSFGTCGDGNGKGLEDEKGYARLLHDMVKLVGSTTSLARGAFRLLGRLEVTKIFFAGVLGTGRFDIAKKLLSNSQVKKLGPQTIEELCLAASREFYDNAESGNLHSGDMKLAYDCLSVPPLTDAIQAERSFIEATSKIYSFRVTSRPGILITPIEIRLIKDRLTLVARVLSENEGAYKYPDVILDLVYKLGYPKNHAVSEVKVYAMLSDSALQAEDFENAAATTERMVALLNQRQRLSPSSLANSSSNESPVDEAREVCWHSCYQLGRQSEYKDAQRKMRLLGHALQLCPSENTLDILTVWRRLEDDTMGKFQEDREKGRGSRGVNGLDRGSRSGALATGSLRAQLSEYAASAARPRLLDQGADAAAIAAKTFNRVAANFPLSLRGMRNRNSEDDGTPRSGSPDVGSQARQAISRGMGWLIGDTD